MRALVLNSGELRSALAGIFEGRESLTAGEWKAFSVLRRQLEAAAARKRLQWLREELESSGLPLWLQWQIMDRGGSRDFTPEQLEAEIQAARERCAQLGAVEVEETA